MVVEDEARRVVLGAVDDAGLQRAEYLIIPHRDAVAAERVHHVDEHRIAHHAHLETLQIVDAFNRLFRVIHAACAGIHPGEANQPGIGVVADLIEQLLADRAVDDFLHMIDAAKQERQIEDVEVVDDRSQCPDADPGELQRADLRLLDRLFLAAQLHRGIHLDAEPAPGRRFELFPHLFDRLDSRIALGMHVGCLEHHFLVGRFGAGADQTKQQYRDRELQRTASIHDVSLPSRVVPYWRIPRRRLDTRKSGFLPRFP